jgi:hypothetical protein
MKRTALIALSLLGAGFPLLVAAQGPVSRSTLFQPRPNPRSTTIAGSTTGSELNVINSYSSDPLNVFGASGVVTGGPYGIGLVGYGANPASGNIGVVGLDSGPGGYGGIGLSNYTSGSAPTASTQTTGLFGESSYGNGVLGETNSTLAESGATLAGVVGSDNTSGAARNVGVLGTTTGGAWGVEATSGNGAYGGVYGQATTGVGVQSFSSSGDAIEAESTSGVGMYVSSSSGDAIEAYGNESGGSGPSDGIDVSTDSTGRAVDATNYSVTGGSAISAGGNYAGIVTSAFGPGNGFESTAQVQSCSVAPRCTGGAGVFGQTNSDVNGTGALVGGVTGSAYYAILGEPATSASYSFAGTNESGAVEITINHDGNIVTNGSVTASGGYAAVMPTAHGYYARAYTMQAASPTLEDENSATLLNGSGIVHLDPAFVEASAATRYQVFLTPKGDCNGLYVSEETPSSFVVRELRGGRSSLAFDYRVVAHPYNHSAERIAVAANPEALSGIQRATGIGGPLATSVTLRAGQMHARMLAKQKQHAQRRALETKRLAVITAQKRVTAPAIDLSALMHR